MPLNGAAGLQSHHALITRGPYAAVRHPTNLLATPVLSAFGQEFRVSLRYSTENFLGIFASSDAIVTYCIRFLTASRVLVQGKYIAYCPFKGNVPPFREFVLELA